MIQSIVYDPGVKFCRADVKANFPGREQEMCQVLTGISHPINQFESLFRAHPKAFYFWNMIITGEKREFR